MRIIISGATGSLGSMLMERLSKKHEVLGLGRDIKKISKLSQIYEIRNCDLASEEFGEIVKDAECFIHCAAYTAPRGRGKKFEENILITSSVLKFLKNHNIFSIFISSASVFDAMPRNKKMVEPTIIPKSHYSKSKFLSEKVIIDSVFENWTGLRPRAVIGKGDDTVIPRLNKLISKKSVMIPGSGEAKLDYTCMSNFLDAVECAIVAGPKQKFYNLSNGNPKSFKELITTYAMKKYGKIKVRFLPIFPLRILATLFPSERINHYSLDQITQPMILDISNIKSELNWQPKQSLTECLEELFNE